MTMLKRSLLVLALFLTSCAAKQDLLRAQKLMKQAGDLSDQGKYQEARPLLEKALQIRREELGPGHADTAETLNDLAALHYHQANYQKAEELYERALKILTTALGAGHQRVAQTQNNLAALLLDLGRLDRAQELFSTALTIREKTLGREHEEVANTLNNLCTLFTYRGNFKRARELAERALKIQQKALKPGHPDLAYSLNNLAMALQGLGDYHNARPLLERALDLREKSLGTRHPLVALSLNNLAMWHWRMGDYAQARPLYERSAETTRQSLGADHPDYAISLNNLAAVLDDMGDYLGARSMYEKSLAIMEKKLGPEHPSVAASLNNLALLLQSMGDILEAEKLLLRALYIKEKLFGQQHPDFLTTLMNLGLLQQYKQDYDEAKRLLEANLEIRESIHGPEHLDIAHSLVPLAQLLHRISIGQEKGERLATLERAEKLYTRALSIFEKLLGPDHSMLTGVLNGLGLLYFSQGKKKDAQELVERAYSIRKKAFGQWHPTVMLNTINVVYMHWALGELEPARKLMQRAFEYIQARIQPLIEATSERERIRLIQSQRGYLNTYLSLFDRPEDTPLTYSAVLRWKGVVANSLAAQRAAVLAAREPELRDKYKQLQSLRRQIARLVFAVAPQHQQDRYQRAVEELLGRKEALERELAQKSLEFKNDRDLTAAGIASICRQLRPDQALVDFLEYELLVPDDPEDPDATRRRRKFTAFILLGGACEKPLRVDVGDARPIDKAVRKYRSVIERGSPASQLDPIGKRLRRLVWDPVTSRLGDRRFVWLVPDGSLNGISFSALVGKDGNYLIESHTFGHLPSGQDLLRLSREGPRPGRGALVAGGIDYNSTEKRAAGGRHELSAPTESSGLFPFEPLPGTKREAETVAKLLEKEATGAVNILSGSQASERNVKEQGPGKRILHLATHGFFATGDVRSVLHGRSPGPGGLHIPTIGFNPMLLSGVVLAGANDRVHAREDDGMLTAMEVSGLDLRGVELVVLSACETGLGELVSGEGVMGLRRAFASAGARALLLTLWKIPDEETRVLMEGFYRRMISGLDKASALRQSQLEMIAKQRKTPGGTHPRTWAAFIVSGR